VRRQLQHGHVLLQPPGVKALVGEEPRRGRLVGGGADAAGAGARGLAALQQALQVALHHGVAMVVLRRGRVVQCTG
jgi:hypothetical protein